MCAPVLPVPFFLIAGWSARAGQDVSVQQIKEERDRGASVHGNNMSIAGLRARGLCQLTESSSHKQAIPETGQFLACPLNPNSS